MLARRDLTPAIRSESLQRRQQFLTDCRITRDPNSSDAETIAAMTRIDEYFQWVNANLPPFEENK